MKASKCSFFKREINFCGIVVENGKIRPDPQKTATLAKTPLCNVKELKGFIGLANWFKDFIPDYAKIAHPLTNLLRKDVKWQWTIRICDSAFELLSGE